MMQYDAPASTSIGAESSPVNAPSRSSTRSARDADVRVPRGFGHRVNRGERRRDDDLHIADVLHHAAQLLGEEHRFCTVLNIFQFPAINGILIGPPDLPTYLTHPTVTCP